MVKGAETLVPHLFQFLVMLAYDSSKLVTIPHVSFCMSVSPLLRVQETSVPMYVFLVVSACNCNTMVCTQLTKCKLEAAHPKKKI